MEIAPLEIGAVDVGDLELAACRRLECGWRRSFSAGLFWLLRLSLPSLNRAMEIP